ncbi:LysM peptidoglycan-binding domain-containing protein [Pseudoprimorskyibacter insulae]|uniref:LysM domain-containing protein n=1 Tax=Pseudoprimorskyibacter insulae TaxID=1695997 RepID=A0A2R8AXY0_9RHOB|nr:LysM peptidoglycan-binding domain-containing protein [Pseudoprimorskyibacter insulae]SPF80891.1 hypothetical protein PRI8871_02704 [Pseudoprimorskyibacter insulae]
MSKLAGLAGSNGIVVAGVAVAGAVVAGLYVSGTFGPKDQTAVQDASVTPVVAAPEPAAKAEPAPVATAKPAPAEVPAYLPKPPSFDVVRLEPNGATLVAGSAASGARVAILLDGAEQSSTEADNSGRFVSFLELGSSAAPRILTLRMFAGDDTIDSEDQVILAATPAPAAEELVSEPVAKAPVEEPATETAVAETPAEDPVAEVAAVEPPAAEPVADAPATEEAPAEDTVAEAPAEAPQAPTTEVAAAPAEPSAQDTPVAPAAETAEAPQTQKPAAALAEAATAAPQPSVDLAGAKPQASQDTPNAVTPPAGGEQVASVAKAPTAAPEPAQEPALPTVILANRDGVKVIQGGAAPSVVSSIALDTIAYDDEGEVALSGRGSTEGFVRVYLDNKPVTTSRIAADGSWRADLPEVDTGVFTLRVDQVDAGGAVTSRVESPFKREDPAQIAAADSAVASAPVKALTVQPGNTLWAIARDRYGEGVLYVKVFEANKDQIRNPDLIYPGQVFAIPD